MGVAEAVYEVEVALKELDTEKPSRDVPVLVKDSVKVDPAAIVME